MTDINLVIRHMSTGYRAKIGPGACWGPLDNGPLGPFHRRAHSHGVAGPIQGQTKTPMQARH